jgi:hypothetical protein
MKVDLFDVSRGPAKYWAQAVELQQAGRNCDQIATELNTNRATANRAVRYGKALLAAGLSDPFVELTAQPTKMVRWRVHRRFKQGPPTGLGEANRITGQDQQISGPPVRKGIA